MAYRKTSPMDPAMVLSQSYIQRRQRGALLSICHHTNLTYSEIIRRAIDYYLRHYQNEKDIASQKNQSPVTTSTENCRITWEEFCELSDLDPKTGKEIKKS